MPTIEFLYDFVSPYSYLASTRVEALARRRGAQVRFAPVLLGGILKLTGNHAPVETPVKYEHLKVDVARWARRLGVALSWPAAHPFSTVLAMRCALAAERLGALVPFTHAAFRAAWVEGRDLTSPEALAEIAGSVGLGGAALVAAGPGEKAALLARTEEAVQRGAFGVPTFFLSGEMFVGNDRLDFVDEALEERRGAAPLAQGPARNA